MFWKMTFAAIAVCGMASVSSGALVVTDGEFYGGNQGLAGGSYDVLGWFSPRPPSTINGNQWQDVWQKDANPTATPPASGTFVVWSGNSSAQNWIYQNIGTKEALDASIEVGYVIGQNNSSGPFTVGIYQRTSGTFEGANLIDVDGRADVTLIDSVTTNFSTGSGAGSMLSQMVELSLDGANTTEPIFLRFHYGGSNYPEFDNVTLSVITIPEPSAIALAGIGLLGLTGLLVWRRRRK